MNSSLPVQAGAAKSRGDKPLTALGSSSAIIDVLMTAYNAAGTIERSVRSILNQEFADLRLIVVDDGSTDETAALLDRLAKTDGRMLVSHRANEGIVSAANAGLKLCTAPYIARLDADDVAFPERLGRQLNFMALRPACVAVSCLVYHIDANGRRLGSVAGSIPQSGCDPCSIPSQEPYIMHPFVLMRRAALEAIGGYRHVDLAEDTDLYWRLQAVGSLEVMNEFLGEYRVHESSTSALSIVHGRISAMNSQRAAISAERRRVGIPDVKFASTDMGRWKELRGFTAMLSESSAHLSEPEACYLRFAAAAKLLELNSYRPYQLELADCIAIHQILARQRAQDVKQLPHVRRHWAIACARLLRTGHPRRALALFDWCILRSTAKNLCIQLVARVTPLWVRRRYRRARLGAARGGKVLAR